MLLAQTFMKIAQLQSLRELSSFTVEISERVLVMLSQISIRILQTQEDTGSWDQGCCETAVKATSQIHGIFASVDKAPSKPLHFFLGFLSSHDRTRSSYN